MVPRKYLQNRVAASFFLKRPVSSFSLSAVTSKLNFASSASRLTYLTSIAGKELLKNSCVNPLSGLYVHKAGTISTQRSIAANPRVVQMAAPDMPKVLNFQKPVADKRLYRHLVLPNKLEVMLVSDPECDRAACCMNVRVGSMFDPLDLNGLAHFLEHMLFLGTEKYPNEEEYSKFLQQHGGHWNAYTTDTNTCYHFAVSPEHLEGAVDRFAQFFIGPLFTQSATDRELNAVHSEHVKNLLTDGFRFHQLAKHLANPKHPFHQFTTGNLQTLRDTPMEKGIDVRKALLDFHNRYYSANIMRLCILGRESLDELEAIVRGDRFELVKNTDVHVPRGDEIGAPEVPFRLEDMGTFIKTVPVCDTRTISFGWLVPEQTPRWETKPTLYLSHLFGHEGKGSLLSALKAQNLATELFAGCWLDVAGLTLFKIDIALPESALGDPKNVDKIAKLVHQYVKLLSENSVQEWIVDELEHLSDMQFRFLSLSPPENYVVLLSEAMHHFPPEKVFAGAFLTWRRDFEEIQSMIKLLTPDRLVVKMSAKAFEEQAKGENWQKEPYYQTPYLREPLKESTLQCWGCAPEARKLEKAVDETEEAVAVRFPEPNPFIPKDLELKKKSMPKEEMPKFPQLLEGFSFSRFPKSRAYFKQDDQFDLPKATLYVRFSCNLPRTDLKGLSTTELYLLTVRQLINEVAYNAEVAGLKYALCASVSSSFSGETGGFEVRVTGFNDRLGALVETLCRAVKEPELKKEAFEVAKTILCRELKIAAFNKQPYQQAMQLCNRFLQDPNYLPHERLAMAESITYEDIVRAAESGALLQGISVDSLVQGNMTESDAEGLLKGIEDTFFEGVAAVEHKEELKPSRVVDLGSAKTKPVRIRARQLAANPKEQNNAVAWTIQTGAPSVRDAALQNVAQQYLSQPFFETLRTKQQLGYIVMCTNLAMLHCTGVAFVVQSPWLRPEGISERIAAFLEEYLGNANKHLSETEFEKLKASVISLLEEKPKHIKEEASRNYKEIVLRRFQFNRREKQVEALKSVTRDQFVEWLKGTLYQSPFFSVEISSHKEPQKERPESKAGSTTAEEVPLKPSTPIEWVDVGEDFNKFLESRREFHEFPLPGGQQLSDDVNYSHTHQPFIMNV